MILGVCMRTCSSTSLRCAIASVFKGRFAQGATTLSLAELLLTKLQVAELNEKDVADSAALFLDHEIGTGARKSTATSLPSARRRLGAVADGFGEPPGDTGPPERSSAFRAGGQTGLRSARKRLWISSERAPKGLRWRMRAKVGDKVAWREEPEETR